MGFHFIVGFILTLTTQCIEAFQISPYKGCFFIHQTSIGSLTHEQQECSNSIGFW